MSTTPIRTVESQDVSCQLANESLGAAPPENEGSAYSAMTKTAAPRTINWLQHGLYLLIVLACILRAFDVWVHNPLDHIFSDTERHWDHGKEPTVPSPMAIFDPPFFQMWMSLVQKWSLSVPELVAIYAAIMSILTPWVWYRFLREALSSKTLALTGWAILAWLPTWFSIFIYFMSETLFLPLLGVSLWMTMRARRKKDLSSFLIMVAWWTAAGLTRGIAVPLAGFAGLWVWWQHPKKVRTAAWSLLLAAFMIAPFAVRNYHHVNLFAPFGNGWINEIYSGSGKQAIKLNLSHNGAVWLYEFGSPSLYDKQLAPFSDWQTSREGFVEINVDLGNGTRDWKNALDATAVTGWDRLRLHFENVVLVMVGDSWPDDNVDYLSGFGSVHSRWIFAPLFLFVVVAGVWRWRDTVQRPLLPILIIVWFYFQAWSLISVNEGRYRKPLEGLLIAQVLVLCDQWRRHKKAALA